MCEACATDAEGSGANLPDDAWQIMSWSVQNNSQQAFMGRGYGLTGAAYIARHLFNRTARLLEYVLYFDRQAYDDWKANQSAVIDVRLYKEFPAGADVPGGVGTAPYQWSLSFADTIEFNGGRDPENRLNQGALRDQGYAKGFLNVPFEVDSALSIWIDPHGAWGATTGNSISIELYYKYENP